jgi:hypothetical protein
MSFPIGGTKTVRRNHSGFGISGIDEMRLGNVTVELRHLSELQSISCCPRKHQA